MSKVGFLIRKRIIMNVGCYMELREEKEDEVT